MTNAFSKGHEREECRKMSRGLWHSIFGLLLSPVPGLGLFLAISGFIRQLVRITKKHRFRNVLFTIIALISLIACVGVLAAEAYVYSRDPEIVDRLAHLAWEKVTGQTEYPWAAGPGAGGVDYGDAANPGLGIFNEDDYWDGSEYADDAIDYEYLPDLESIMDDIRHPFAQYEF